LQRDGNPCEAQGQPHPALDGFQVDEHAVLVPQRHASLAAKHSKANIDRTVQTGKVRYPGQMVHVPMEQFYEDTKGECGLDHYQGRRWDGLPRHLALVMLAYSFLARQCWMPTDPVGFSPSRERPSFPAVHRQVLLWLFQDVVLWLIATNQIAHFRPRRV
jgi:hypothetical protein